LRKIKSWFKNSILVFIPKVGKGEWTGDFPPRIVVLANWENLGDFVLFSSVVRETRNQFPNSKLFVVAQKENAGLVEYCPYVDRWIWVKGHKTAKSGEGHGKATSYTRKMIVTYFALLRHGRGKIDLLIGPDWLLVEDPDQFTNNFIYKHVNEGRNSLTETAKQNHDLYRDHAHQVDRMLSILQMFGIRVLNNEIENWTLPVNRINQNLIEQQKTNQRVLISLGAGQARRNWPIENILEVIELMIKEFPEIEFTILGPKSFDESSINALFPASKNLTNLIGRTSLSQISELMLSANLLLSNDSGLIHIASTLKLPCVVVSAHPLNGNPWHLHSPNRYHPWQTKYVELQPKDLIPPCEGSCQAFSPHCITSITPIEVFEACKSLLVQS
jgi:ADP-heptose:LPS heptosyltransferase